MDRIGAVWPVLWPQNTLASQILAWHPKIALTIEDALWELGFQNLWLFFFSRVSWDKIPFFWGLRHHVGKGPNLMSPKIPSLWVCVFDRWWNTLFKVMSEREGVERKFIATMPSFCWWLEVMWKKRYRTVQQCREIERGGFEFWHVQWSKRHRWEHNLYTAITLTTSL